LFGGVLRNQGKRRDFVLCLSNVLRIVVWGPKTQDGKARTCMDAEQRVNFMEGVSSVFFCKLLIKKLHPHL
jgi:hypothetical protein